MRTCLTSSSKSYDAAEDVERRFFTAPVSHPSSRRPPNVTITNTHHNHPHHPSSSDIYLSSLPCSSTTKTTLTATTLSLVGRRLRRVPHGSYDPTNRRSNDPSVPFPNRSTSRLVSSDVEAKIRIGSKSYESCIFWENDRKKLSRLTHVAGRQRRVGVSRKRFRYS